MDNGAAFAGGVELIQPVSPWFRQIYLNSDLLLFKRPFSTGEHIFNDRFAPYILVQIYFFFFFLQILDDEISADFYVAVPDMLQKLVPLKNKLRKKFPKSKRGNKSERKSEAF